MDVTGIRWYLQIPATRTGNPLDMTLANELCDHLAQFHAAPFLFIGSGISRRYLGLEDWESLLRRMARLTGRPYEYFRSSANGSLPAIASEIARELHGDWWAKPEFEESRVRYKSEAISRESALKIEISKYLDSASQVRVSNHTLEKELELLPHAVVDGIITTNWDLLLEGLFPDFEVYVGQDELLFAAIQGVGEIYKIHGCCSRPNSLIATAADYEQFNERNPYLAAKLLTTFAEHPVVFLGYSVNDENVSGILSAIAGCLTTDNIDQLRDRLVLVNWDAGHESHAWADNTIVTHHCRIPVRSVSTASFVPIFEALSALPRKFPAPILRRLKDHVYQLVHDNDPANQLYVLDIDQDTNLADVKVVYGVGLHVFDRNGAIRVTDDETAVRVRLSDDPDLPVIPFRAAAPEYASNQEELDALVRAWHSDHLAYVPASRLRAFYAARLELALNREALECMLVSSMHHNCPTHFWAARLGRSATTNLLRAEVPLDLFPRIRAAARLTFAVGGVEGEPLLKGIARNSRHVAVRTLANRLLGNLANDWTVAQEYRSPARSSHVVNGQSITLDTANLFAERAASEKLLSSLATLDDPASRQRVRQVDALLYGLKL